MPNTRLRFVHISDTHYSAPDYKAPPSRIDPRTGVEKLIEQVNALPFMPDFILHTGDVAYDPYPDIYNEIKQVFSAFKAPLLYIPGNHDHSATLQTVLMGRSEEDIMYPLYHAEVVNGVRLLFLDANNPKVPPPAARVEQEQLAWLDEQLNAKDPRPIVVATHHPLLKTGFSEWFDTFMMTHNGDTVHALLKTAADRIRGVFFGHVHQNLTFHRDGILYSSVNSSWTQFFTLPGQDMQTLNDLDADPSFNVVTVTDESTIIQRYAYRVDI